VSLTIADVKKIAHLARLNMTEKDAESLTTQLSTILNFVESMNQTNTDTIEPISHSIDASQRMRPDAVTETDHRAEFQAIAPQVEAGLYLVPKVIE
jgi:aspartyl-tRNA(Asn)/glutamyl-tRNA(Gln) amidotransferase subunit C